MGFQSLHYIQLAISCKTFFCFPGRWLLLPHKFSSIGYNLVVLLDFLHTLTLHWTLHSAPNWNRLTCGAANFIVIVGEEQPAEDHLGGREKNWTLCRVAEP